MYKSSTSISAAGETAVLDVRFANSALVNIQGGGVNATGANFAFEVSMDSEDGTDGAWFSIQGARTNANTVETSTGVLAPAAGAPVLYGHRLNVSNARWLRLRATAITAGDVVVHIRASDSSIEPTPVSQTHAVTMSGTWAITPAAAGTVYSVATAATTNAAVIKNAASTLIELTVSNPTATPVYVKLYQKASAPTVGTDVPVMTIPVPATSVVAFPFAVNGKRFSTGIAIAATGGPLANDTTAAPAGVQIHGSYL